MDIESVETYAPGVWLVSHLMPDGRMFRYLFPHASFDYRSAEYGFDPNDIDTLLDVVLHEQFIDIPPDHPHFVYNTDPSTARAHYLSQIRAAKETQQYSDPFANLDLIRQSHPRLRQPDLHESHRRFVMNHRAARMVTKGF